MNFGCKANNIYLPLTLTTYIFLHVFGENLPFIQNVSRPAQSSVSWKKVLGVVVATCFQYLFLIA